MSDKVQLIKQEIERRFNDNMKASEQYTEKSKSHALFTSAAKEDYDLLAFIDSLSEEPKCIYNRTLEERKKFCKYCSAACSVRIEEEPVSENLEEEFYRFIDEEEGIPKMCNTREYIAWGVDIARHFAEWQKQQMMKDAVNGEVVYQIGSAEIAPTDIQYKIMSDRVYIPNVKLGDKVKIIIVKEEQQ